MKTMFKFNHEKFAQRATEEKRALEEARSTKKVVDITRELIVKVDKPGDYEFRAVPYIFNEDFESNPFPIRQYHLGIPGTKVFYCPKNHGESCDVCEFVWGRLMENKANGGDKETREKWNKYLPKRKVIIPGIFVGERASEGLKYFTLTTHDNKMSDEHEKIWKWLTSKSTYYFLDPVNGFNMILQYEAYEEAKQKRFGGATQGFKSIDLSRESTPISDNPEETWKMIEETMKNIDSGIPGYEKSSHSDSIKVLNKWLETEEKWAKKNNARKPPVDSKKDGDGSVLQGNDKVVDEESAPYAPKPAVEAPAPASTESSDARRERMRGMLKR